MNVHVPIEEKTSVDDQIEWILDHPGMSDWLKTCIRTSESLDPNRLLSELEILTHVLRGRAIRDIDVVLNKAPQRSGI